MIVSEGTHRTEDLLPRFIEEIKSRRTQPAYCEALIKEAELWLLGPKVYFTSYPNYTEYELCGEELLAECFEALNHLAPAGHYFGTHEGDGACFGFFPAGPKGDE